MRIPGLALLSALFLAGCAIPPAVTVVSLVADGISYAATGKSTTDHAISAVARQDCALLRAVQDEAICDPDGEVLVELVRSDPSEENWTDHGDFHLQGAETTTSSESADEIATVNLPL